MFIYIKYNIIRISIELRNKFLKFLNISNLSHSNSTLITNLHRVKLLKKKKEYPKKKKISIL